MGERTRRAGLVLAALTAMTLSGCAVQGGPAALETPGSATPVSTPGATPGTTPGGAGDGPPQYSLNKRHHERTEVRDVDRPALQSAAGTVRRALADAPRPVTEAAARQALADAGAPDPWLVVDATTGAVRFEAQVDQHGCLVGGVDEDGTVTAEPDGFVLDGGCHALDGH
ncbi:hypothetical protein EDF24_1546 [Curtobacterium sp. PhB130]|uniref:hypothetical protein n=1 Tax=unclassified Curtobacterium TaxID=257496 RepID=UPI000F4C1708|nr:MULTISPECIES: hypothetical protein [unclassified Curtobacterium]ROP60956.1 hypothetical protein EDF55_2958 [Curtobacterium sp. ZW137]ROS75970.1 hypothetical protein EDF24_1546 [Curtobacterium sp. PhB130]